MSTIQFQNTLGETNNYCDSFFMARWAPAFPLGSTTLAADKEEARTRPSGEEIYFNNQSGQFYYLINYKQNQITGGYRCAVSGKMRDSFSAALKFTPHRISQSPMCKHGPFGWIGGSLFVEEKCNTFACDPVFLLVAGQQRWDAILRPGWKRFLFDVGVHVPGRRSCLCWSPRWKGIALETGTPGHNNLCTPSS